MKKLIAATTFLLLFCSLANTLHAQSEDNRNKLEMTIGFGGKTIANELNSLSTSITRYTDESYAGLVKDTTVEKGKSADERRGSFYLSMVVKKMSPELLSLFAKRQTRFDGTIKIIDTYGKNPTTVISFGGAVLETYSDQFSGASYNDSYSGANVVFSCKALTVNGVVIEP